MLQAVLFICNIASQQCTLAPASSRFTIVCENQTPMGCYQEAYAQLARMNGLYDDKTQTVRVSVERKR